MRHQVSDKDIPGIIEKFVTLIQAVNNPLSADHFLTPLFDQYHKWNGQFTLGNIPPEILTLAGIAASVFAFKNDWHRPEVKGWMINRIRNNDQVRGILFEFRAAVHYLRFHKEVQWLPCRDGKESPDIRVVTESGAVIYTECTRKQENSKRAVDSERLIQDVRRTLHGKMKQRRDFAFPLHLVIYIPEEHPWESHEFNTRLGNAIHRRFENKIYEAISAVTVISAEEPAINRKTDGTLFYDTSLPAIVYKNRNARNPFPCDFAYQVPGMR